MCIYCVLDFYLTANTCSSGQTISNSATVDPNPTSESTGYTWSLNCSSGYTPSAASGSMICNPGGTWTNIPSCTANTCSGGQTLSNSASIDPTTAQDTGYSWTVSCNSGYAVSAGSGSMMCSPGGSWTNKPTCNAYTCSGSHTITDSASVNPTSGGQTGDAFTLSCNTGYTSSAASGTMMQCDGSNVWTNKPSCNGKYTSSLDMILTLLCLANLDDSSM